MSDEAEIDVAEIDRQMYDRPSRAEKWDLAVKVRLFLYFALCVAALLTLPNPFYEPGLAEITFALGGLGLWRYSWWFNHWVRSEVYARRVYPRMRDEGQKVWEEGWRPRHLHFMMTTYKEEPEITHRVVGSIIREIRDSGVPATIWLGSSDRFDEDIIQNFLEANAQDLDLTFRIIRQDVGGKRAAIGIVLRAMNRLPIAKDDLIIFMDGDFAMEPGCVRFCLPLFKVYPDLHACTTDEEVVVVGPKWILSWLRMRFAQRRLAMQSHSLSGRVLTLTGRLSVFRAEHLMKREFIRLLEADFLDHWLWGKFRFLSGDDKSTWYFLLGQGIRMLYVPDALGYTIEVIEGSGMSRMVQNFRRWSGNMLRNGRRAIAYGPRRMPFFIWWCLLDQRIAIWTMLVSPTLVVCAGIVFGWVYVVGYVVFIAITRMLLSMVLYTYSRRVDMMYPWILYLNQLINASVKVYSLWRLSKQKWSNRGAQSAGFGGDAWVERMRNGMAMFLTSMSVGMLVLFTLLYTELLHVPATSTVMFALGL